MTVSARALRLLILTVSRTTEVRLLAFPEFEEEIWTLPDARTKTGIGRRIPLVAKAYDRCEPRFRPRLGAWEWLRDVEQMI